MIFLKWEVPKIRQAEAYLMSYYIEVSEMLSNTSFISTFLEV
jgi:hypothetical protein